MADTMKIKLLKKLYSNNVGDVIEVRNHEARTLVTIGHAEYYVEPASRVTSTRVMQPTPTPIQPSQPDKTGAEITENTENLGEGVLSSGRYGRRDMQPEE